MKSLITLLLTFTMLAGCANGGGMMRWEAGPDFDDADFSESLTDFNYFMENAITDYDYGEIKFAPVAVLNVNARDYLVERVFVMDGGLAWVYYFIGDDQFKVTGYQSWKNISVFQSLEEQADRFTLKIRDQGGWWVTRMYTHPQYAEVIRSFIEAEVEKAGGEVIRG